MPDSSIPKPDTPRRRKAATLREVALAAGVSTATVSKFINGGQRGLQIRLAYADLVAAAQASEASLTS